jgi:hypothetical protein
LQCPFASELGSVTRDTQHVPVSVPRIACLIDHVKYLEPSDVKPPTDATERRRFRHRGPTLRSLVKWAVACDSAEQTRRATAPQVRRRAATPGNAAGWPRPRRGRG